MLHKIFKKNNFRRPPKSVNCSNNRVIEVADDSDSYNESCPVSVESSPKKSKKDVPYKAPVATQEHGRLCSETESLKKVKFDEPMSSNYGKQMMSPDGVKRQVSTDLFDGNVLEKLQAGDIGIADFLRKSPTATPTLCAKAKNRSLSDSSVPLERQMSAPTPRQVTLLDRAHSMKVKQKQPSPVQKSISSTSITPFGKKTKPREAVDSKCLRGEMSRFNPQPINGNGKHRFSRSLETLAQEVFGEEFQKYLEGASISTTQKKHHKCLPYQSSTERSSGSTITNSNDILQSNVAPQEPISFLMKKLKSLTVDVSSGHGKGRLKSPVSGSVSGGESTCRKSTQESSASYCSVLSPMETLHIWLNEGDPRPASDVSSTNSVDNEISRPQLQCMKPIQEGEKSGSHSRNTSVDSLSKQNFGSDPTLGNHHNCLMLRRRKFSRFSTSDSQYVNPGSFNDGDDLNATESSLMNLNFPPPPPPPAEEDLVTPQITSFYTERYETQPNESFDSDSRCATSGSTEYQCNSPIDNNAGDPIINSLLSVVPLPEEKEQLVPVLSKALGEIVSEIIASRRKLERMMKAIEIHQQVLKDQNIQIQKHNKEITEMRKTACVLKNPSTMSGEHSPVSNCIHTRSRNSTDNSNENEAICNNTRQSDSSHPQMLKRIPSASCDSSASFQSKSKYRQSREIVELNQTLDKLLNQCSALQQTSCPSADEHADSDTSSRTFPLSSNVRRVRSMPSRKIKHSKNSIFEDKTA